MSAFMSLPVRPESRVDLSDYVSRIRSKQIYEVAVRTDLTAAPSLSRELDQPVLIKREDQQPIRSFKIRGAANAVAQLTSVERRTGVVTASAGNHAQGVALTAKRLGMRAVIVMPCMTPSVKIDGVKKFGAEVILHGQAFSEALAFALNLQKTSGLTFVHPYDDKNVIAGQGTVGQEILEDYSRPIEAIFWPVGGGGLIAGGAAVVKSMRPDIKIIGVQLENAACLHHALRTGFRYSVTDLDKYSDGTAVGQVGRLNFEVAQAHVDGTLCVSRNELCKSATDIFGDTGVFPEPAGALAVAGMRKYAEQCLRRTDGALIPVLSGANLDPERQNEMMKRSLHHQRMSLIQSPNLVK